MNISSITNTTVRAAIQALQEHRLDDWYALFSENPVFTDDGNTLHFTSFFDNAFEKKEKFLSISKVENEGKTLYGRFFAGQWGTFDVFFKFHLNNEGKINRLDIGQTT